MRRLITFGVIKGFLYRVHKYVIAPAAVKKPAHRSAKKNVVKSGFGGGGAAATSRSMEKEDKCVVKARQPQDGVDEKADTADDPRISGGEDKKTDIFKYLDGTHCFDEICTELMISERELMGRLKEWGDVQIIHR